MGHLFHGFSRALCSHVLRYGFLTINGRTGGWRFEASTTLAKSAAAAATKGRMVPIKYNRRNKMKNKGMRSIL
jgi:hypothetical protein